MIISIFKSFKENQYSRYAKGMFDCFMEITGNVAYMVEHSFAELEAIRSWSKREFTGDGYYNFVEVSFTHKGEIIRTTTFPDAYVASYDEDVDSYSGQGTFTLILKQKLDKMNYIEFNGVAAVQQRRQRLSPQPMPLDFLAVDRPRINNPPEQYWIHERNLTSTVAQVVSEGGSVNLRQEPNTNSRILTTIPRDTNLRVIQARGFGDERWFNVMFGTYTGWVAVRAGGNWLVMGSAQHENIVVVESDRVAEIRKTPSGERHATLPPFGGGVGNDEQGVGLENGTRVTVAPYPNTVNGWVRIESWRAGLASRINMPTDNQNNLIPPGTGTLSPNGLSLLKEYEDLGVGFMIYRNGELVAIRSRDVEGEGNITFGFGVLFRNTPEYRERLMRDYGLPFVEGVEVSVDIANRMLQNFLNSPNNMPALHNFTHENNIWLTQHQLDALIIHRYLRPATITGEFASAIAIQNLLIEMFNEPNAANRPSFSERYHDRLYETLLNDLRGLRNWPTFGGGWANRVKDTLELFFYGDAVRNH